MGARSQTGGFAPQQPQGPSSLSSDAGGTERSDDLERSRNAPDMPRYTIQHRAERFDATRYLHFNTEHGPPEPANADGPLWTWIG